jgi:hypothetical protein
VIGYTGEISEEELDSPEFAKDNPGDVVGFDFASVPLSVTGLQNIKGAQLWQVALAKGELPGRSPAVADFQAAGFGPGTPVNGAIAVLSNGDYVVASPDFAGSVGAATFGSGTIGVIASPRLTGLNVSVARS